jgi:hypothetical protein
MIRQVIPVRRGYADVSAGRIRAHRSRPQKAKATAYAFKLLRLDPGRMAHLYYWRRHWSSCLETPASPHFGRPAISTRERQG